MERRVESIFFLSGRGWWVRQYVRFRSVGCRPRHLLRSHDETCFVRSAGASFDGTKERVGAQDWRRPSRAPGDGWTHQRSCGLGEDRRTSPAPNRWWQGRRRGCLLIPASLILPRLRAQTTVDSHNSTRSPGGRHVITRADRREKKTPPLLARRRRTGCLLPPPSLVARSCLSDQILMNVVMNPDFPSRRVVKRGRTSRIDLAVSLIDVSSLRVASRRVVSVRFQRTSSVRWEK